MARDTIEPMHSSHAEKPSELELACSQFAGGLVDLSAAVVLAKARMERSSRLKDSCKDAVSQLLIEASHSSQLARERLVSIWMRDVLHWCRWLASDRLCPEDIAQEVLLVVFSDVHKIRQPESFRAWLRSLTWRKVRAEKRRAWFRLRSVSDKERVEHPDMDMGMSVQKVLSKLKQEERELLCLCYVEGLTRQELAESLQWPVGTLNRKISRARQSFERQATLLGLDTELAGGSDV